MRASEIACVGGRVGSVNASGACCAGPCAEYIGVDGACELACLWGAWGAWSASVHDRGRSTRAAGTTT